ncbi:MAG: MEDS domain-containing protein [Methanobacterium sp.]
MSEEQRPSGVDIIGPVPWGTHFCQFYETKEDLIDILVPYFKEGLNNNEYCMWVTSAPLNVAESQQALRRAVPNIDDYLESGQLKIIPYTEWYMIEGNFDSNRVLTGWIDKLNNALDNGFDGLRLTGNTFWLENEDWNDFIDYEVEVDSVIGNYRMIAMCTYCLDRCNANDIVDVVDNHKFALIKRDGEWELFHSSKQKKLENELKSTKYKYDSLFTNILDGYAHCEMIYDNQDNPIDFIYLKVNDKFENLTGLKDVEDKKVSELIPSIKDVHPELFEIYSRVASTGNPERFEIEFKPLNKWLNIAVHSPQKNHFVAVFEDISGRKKAEEEVLNAKKDWESTFDAVPDLIAIVDKDYSISRVNEAMSSRLGINMEDCTGRKCYELVHGLNEPPFICPHAHMLLDGQEHTLEVHEDKLDGEFINSSSPIYNKKNELIGSVHVLRDITEVKKSEKHVQEMLEKEYQLTEELQSSNEKLQSTTEDLYKSNVNLQEQKDKLSELVDKLEVSNRALEQFAYVASHDLQEPLRMVSSFTQLLEKRYKGHIDEEADDYINFAVDGAKRMQLLINDLLAYSRVNTKGEKFGDVDLEKVLDEVLFNLEIVIEENQANITKESLPHIYADYRQMVQLFQNLIVNAMKYRSDEPPQIFIYTQKEDDYWIFSVADNGIGIDPQYNEQIFRIFRRLHTHDEYEGTGIGLAIADRIIRRHDGRIWVKSKLGEGSTFYFTIPNTIK